MSYPHQELEGFRDWWRRVTGRGEPGAPPPIMPPGASLSPEERASLARFAPRLGRVSWATILGTVAAATVGIFLGNVLLEKWKQRRR